MDVPQGVESLLGRRFGRLTVIDYEGMNAQHATLWLCACDCGREKVVQRTALLNGTTWRCGRNCPIDTGMLPGRTFGALTLVCRLNDSASQSKELWLCRCECGNEVEETTRRLRKGIVTSCGCRTSCNRRIRQAVGAVNQTRLASLGDKPRADNTTGVRGVSYYKDVGKYVARIKFRGHNYTLGKYTRLEDARRVREMAERAIFDPALESSGMRYPSHDECLRIVADIRERVTRKAEPA